VQAGDLVVTTRAQIGVPAGAIGLIITTHEPRAVDATYKIHEVQLYGVKHYSGYYRRFLSKDLEVVNNA
jgi:hypothetical protein